MVGEFRAAPEGMRDLSGKLRGVGSEYGGVGSDLRAEVGGGGDAISAGDAKSFWTQFDWVVGSLEAKGKLLDHYGDALKGAADTFQGSDEA
jgi:hypothetical protein